MSNTSSDLPLSLPECNSSCCSRSKQNEDKSKKNTAENYRVKPQSLSEDRSEHYARLLKESEQALANRNVLISLLQEQLVKMEELHKKTHEKHSHYNMSNCHPLHNKSAEDMQPMRRCEDKLKTEDKSLAKVFENWGAQQKLETIFEKTNQPEGQETPSGGELTMSAADSSDLSLVDSMRSLNVIHIKSVRSKIETEFFQECQVNFEGPEHTKEIAELLHAQEEIDSLQNKFHPLTRALNESPPDRSQTTNERGRNNDLEVLSNFSSFEEQSLYESPRHKKTMAESELRMLSEQLFQKEYVINAQQKKMRRLEDKLERTYQELIKQLIKNKKPCRDCEGSLDTASASYRNLQKVEALKKSESHEGTTCGLQNKLSSMLVEMEKAKNDETTSDLQNKLSCMLVEMEKAKKGTTCSLQNKLSSMLVEMEKAKNDETTSDLQNKLSCMLVEMEKAKKGTTCSLQNKLSSMLVEMEKAKNDETTSDLQNKLSCMLVEMEKAKKGTTCSLQNKLSSMLVEMEKAKNDETTSDLQNKLSCMLVEMEKAKKGIACSLQNKLSSMLVEMEKAKNEEITNGLQNNSSCVLVEMEKTKSEKLESYNLDLTEKLSSLFEEVKSQVTMAIKREQDVDVLQTKIIQMASELVNANKEITKCVDQNRTLLEDYEVKLEHVQNQYRLAKKENENLEAVLHQKDAHLKQLEQELETSDASKSQDLSEAKNVKETLESQLLEKDKRMEILDQNFKQMAEELDNTNQERARFIQEVQKLFGEYDVKLAVIKGECENAQKKILQLRRNKTALNVELTTAQAETEKLKRDYETLSKKLEASNQNGANLMKEVKKLKGEMQTREDNARGKIAMLLKQLEDSDGARDAYVEENKKLFCRYESEMRQLNDDCEKMREEMRRLKKEKPIGEGDASPGKLLGELRARVIQLEEDKENLQSQVFTYEEQLENQCEEYERKIMLINGTQSKQREEEISKLRAKISEMEAAQKRGLTNQDGNKVSEASLSGKSSDYSIHVIKEESVLEAYEELVTEKEFLEGKLKEMLDELEDERKSKTQLENELSRFRENERTVNENLRRILPEFLGQGDKCEAKTNPSSGTLDLQNKVILLSEELEHAREDKFELIKKGKQIFYHYEANIIKLKSDYERVRNEMLQMRGGDGSFCKQGDGESLDRISTHYKSMKEEAQQLKESQEAYSKKLTCCLQELAVYKDDVKNWMEAYDRVVREKSDLETETKILVNNVLHKDEAIKEMQDKLGQAQEELARIRKDNGEKQKVISDYHIKYIRLSSDYEDAQNKLGQLKQGKDEMNQKITAKDKLIRQYEEQVGSEREENARLNEDVAILKNKLSTLEEEIEEKEKEFYVQLDETKSALFDVTQNYEKLEIEYGYLSEQQEDIGFYKTQNAKLVKEIEERGEKIKSLKGEIEELEKELCSVRTEVDLNNASASLNWEELQSACADLEKKLELTKYALKKQECQAMIKADDDFKDLQRQIETLKEKLDHKDEEISRLSEELGRAQKEKAELNSHMADTMRELEEEIEEIKANNRLLREQITDRSQQLLQQKQNETSKENECENLKQQLKEAHTQRTSLEADSRKLRETLQTVKVKNEKLQADISRMEKELLVNKSWKAENAQLQEKLDNIESELFGVKHQCSEVHEQLKTTKIKLVETQEELSHTKRHLEGARSSITACGEETKNESHCSGSYSLGEPECGSFFSSKTETLRDGDGRSICMKVNLEKRNCQESDMIKLNKQITVLYNNTKFTESRCETESTLSNVMLARGTKIQERLASLNQMEKEVEEMISAVQQQNKKLRDCHMARVKNEKEIDTRLQKVRQRRDTLATDFNTFQAEIGHRIDHAVSIRKQFENT